MKKIELLQNIWAKVRKALSYCARHTGLPMVYLGVILYAIFYFTGLTNYNILLYVPLLLIIIGVIGFVRHKKTEGLY